ncbi:MAG: diacylglycerol kinase family protein [Oscillospiraceae bacterium]
MEHVFIINPVSGKKGVAEGLRTAIEAAAKARGVPVSICHTRAPRHATQIAQSHAQAGGAVRLYAVGGDGTLNEVFTGAYPFPNAEVASIPCGSGNDFVRSLGTVDDFLDIPAQLAGTAVSIDLMQVDAGISAAITSAGLDANVAYNIPKYRRLPLVGGSMAYNISILEQLLKPLGMPLSISLDGHTQQGNYLIATVCNGQYYGGGFRAAPMASLDDGVLEVILVKKLSRFQIASIIGKYKKGAHYADGAIIPSLRHAFQHFRAQEVTITPTGTRPFILNVDGECGPAPRLYAKVMPKAARFVLPPALFAAWSAASP